MTAPSLEVSTVQARSDLGFVAALAVGTDRIVGVGGQSEPLVLLSSTGRAFTDAVTPGHGLRHVVAGDGWVAVCGEYGTLAVTRDVDALLTDGQAWREIELETSGCLYGLAHGGGPYLWVAGDDGYCAQFTVDGEVLEVPLGLTQRIFFAVPVGDELCLGLDDGRLVVLSGSDTVDIRPTGTDQPLTGLTVTPTGAMVVCGDHGFLARSTDGGRTFTVVDPGTPLSLEDVACLPDGRVAVVGGHGLLLLSGDDGRTFAPVPTGVTETLWSLAVFGRGLLIGGAGGLVLRLAPPGDEPWADRPDVYSGPRPLDGAFAGGPDGFLGDRLAAYLAAVSPAAVRDEAAVAPVAAAFERVWGTPLPDEYRAFAAATVHVDPWSSFEELRLDADLLPDLPAGENLFEWVVRRDQQAYLGTGLAEVFGGAFHVGSQGNGDTYHLAVYPQPAADDNDPPRPRPVLHYEHELHRFSDVFADQLSTMVYLAALFQARDARLVSRPADAEALRSLYGRVAPTWHFSMADHDDDFEELEQYLSRVEYFYHRSHWIQMLLKNDRVREVEDAAGFFHENLNPAHTAELVAARLPLIAGSVPTALYAMWRAYLFGEPELDAYLDAGRGAPARLTRDSVALIDELRAGTRTGLGSIGDVPAWLARFRALDLDPRRAEAREAEAAQAAVAVAARADEIRAHLATVDSRQWTDLAWAHLDDAVYHRTILAVLDGSPGLTRLRETFELADAEQGLAAAALAPRLDPVLEPLLIGSLVRDEPASDEGIAALRGASVLEARAAAGLLDPRAAVPLRILLRVEEKYNHRRRLAVRLLTGIGDEASGPALAELIRATPMVDVLDSIGKKDLLVAAAEALRRMPTLAAIDALSTMVTPAERHYHAVRGPAGQAIAAALSRPGSPHDVGDDVLDGLLLGVAEISADDESTECHLAYGLIARELTPERRAAALARLEATASRTAKDNAALARGFARWLAGGDPGDLAGPLSTMLTRPAWSDSSTTTRLRQALRMAALRPELVDPADLAWLTALDDPEVRAGAHTLLARLGRPTPPLPAYDHHAAAALSDAELVAAIGAPAIGRATLIAESGHRALASARPPVIAAVLDVAARTDAHRSPLAHDRRVLDAGVAMLARGEVTDEVAACFDTLLRHPNHDIKWDLLRCAPADPRLIPGMQHVVNERWGWQESTATEWLTAP